MEIFFATFGFFLLIVVVMGVGYIFQKKTIAGSCGGLAALNIDKACNCDEPCERRRTRLEKERQWKQNQIT